MAISTKRLTGAVLLALIGLGGFYAHQTYASENSVEPVSATLALSDHSDPVSDDVLDTRTEAVKLAQAMTTEEALASTEAGTCVLVATADLEGGDNVLIRSGSWIRDHYCVIHNKATAVVHGLFSSDDEAVATTE